MRLAALLALCWVAGAQQPAPGRGVNFYSLEKEAALGADLAAEANRHFTPVDSAAIRAYVNRLGQRLVSQLPDTRFQLTFTLIADAEGGSTHEPLALPGGYIFVPVGLITSAQNEAELAGMLAHSMAHVTARHATRAATRADNGQIGIIIPEQHVMGWTGYDLRQGANMTVPLGFLTFQRTMELEADRLAVRAMAGAGYDPASLTAYIRREQAAPGSTRQVFAKLPTVEQRTDALEHAIGELPAQTYSAPASEEFQAMQNEVRRLLTPVRPAPTLGPPRQ